MLIGKTYDQIMEDMRRRVESGAVPGLSWSAGAITRALLAACAEELAEAYRTIDYAVQMRSLSKSTGLFLDMIGAPLGVYRADGESDDAYRARIAAQEPTRAGMNATALRIACLSAEYVRDVVLKPYPYGPGSFAVYVIPERRDMYEQAIAAVQAVLDAQTAGGVQGVIMRPVEIPVDIEIMLFFKEGTLDRVRADVRTRVREAVRNYIENIEPGGEFADTDVVALVKAQSKEITTFEVTRFAVGGLPAVFSRQLLEWNERFIAGTVRVV